MRTSARISEKQFQAQVLQLARLSGWLTYHTHDSRRSQAGFPDLVLVRPPAVLFAELKSEGGGLRPEQRGWLRALEACPGVAVRLWMPGDWPEVEEMLARPRRRRGPDKPKKEEGASK